MRRFCISHHINYPSFCPVSPRFALRLAGLSQKLSFRFRMCASIGRSTCGEKLLLIDLHRRSHYWYHSDLPVAPISAAATNQSSADCRVKMQTFSQQPQALYRPFSGWGPTPRVTSSRKRMLAFWQHLSKLCGYVAMRSDHFINGAGR